MSIDRLQPISPAALAARTPRVQIPPSRAGASAESTALALMDDADAFRDALQRAIAQGASAAAVASEATRRIARGHLDVAALRAVLFETAGTDVWSAVRQAALTAVAASPALAPSIISMHAQLLRTPSGKDRGTTASRASSRRPPSLPPAATSPAASNRPAPARAPGSRP
ncbi:hypothetical protein ABZS79_34590 [Streptomyces griseoloalbus]|uniref:hypothetical protein n=1 Tax=Streptomyces griseoloalbus TaxID=67303 RepID=UPI0033BA46A9